MSEPHVHTAACYDREDDGHVALACGHVVSDKIDDPIKSGCENTEDDHVWSMGVCTTCGTDCPEGCDGGSFSEDRYSYGRNEGHYTVERPCPVCNPSGRDESEPEDQPDYDE